MRNHAHSVLANDFFVVVTAAFRMLYVFVVLDVGTRRILHRNVTAYPTADWTAQLSDDRMTRSIRKASIAHLRPWV